MTTRSVKQLEGRSKHAHENQQVVTDWCQPRFPINVQSQYGALRGGAKAKPSWQRSTEGLRFADAVDCPDPATAGACLRARSPEELVSAVEAIGFGENIANGIVTTHFGPTVDGWVLPEDPVQALAGGRFNHVP